MVRVEKKCLSANPKWIALRKVKPEDSYSSAPDRDYYEQRLGRR